MIETRGLRRDFGSTRALRGVDLQVPAGHVLGLLGHNGAGKTTAVNILATLLPPTGGSATVAGFDVVRQAAEVRRHIGLTGQFAAVDADISGLDNLILLARLLGAGRQQARRRAEELLAVFDLAAAGRRKAATYSGGMRRRLDLAASLVGHPAVLFLDEPTTGLDPASRLRLWELIEDLVREGTAVLLTTQYLEEAERLAGTITVLSQGAVLAAGPTEQLKAEVGSRAVRVTPAGAADGDRAALALAAAGLPPVREPGSEVLAVPIGSTGQLVAVVRALDEAGVEPVELSVTEPTLADVYLALTKAQDDRVPALQEQT
ncbi:ATP-binding cassette domain-containing protein [Micromonospora sp. NPDC051296]|uniref:ATP-binding cassette domain-containing protein n=1 Tax=Micromonospora sp. NPDC051296 TaxID=3155046 RepID=UPI00342F43C0